MYELKSWGYGILLETYFKDILVIFKVRYHMIFYVYKILFNKKIMEYLEYSIQLWKKMLESIIIIVEHLNLYHIILLLW